MGRLVITHSTYIEGLIPVLKQLANEEYIKTVVPGEIKRVRGQRNGLYLKVSIKIKGGYKVIARRGKSVQEVFIIGNIESKLLEERLNSLAKLDSL